MAYSWVESPNSTIQAWLSARRLVDERPLAMHPAHSAAYQQMFDACVDILGLREQKPLLHLTRTAQAISETMRLPSGQAVVIYDKYQGRVSNRLNRFMFESFPHDLVVRFFLRHMRIALFTAGMSAQAALAGLLLQGWPFDGPRSPEPPPTEESPPRFAYTTAQEWFVIAHEVAHLAIEAGKVDPGLNDLVDTAVARVARRIRADGFLDYLEDETRADDIAGVQAVFGSETAERFAADPALARHLGPEYLDELSSFVLKLPDVVGTTPHIREEALCDLLAAIVVIEASNMPAPFVVLALKLGLTAHTTLTIFRHEVVRRAESSNDTSGETSNITGITYNGLRGWLFTELLMGYLAVSDEDVPSDYGSAMAAQQQQHDRRVRSVANWVPSLLVGALKTEAFRNGKVSSWPSSWVRSDIFEEMGSEGTASPT